MNESRQVKDVAEYLKEVSEIKAKWPNSTLVFRGQENEEWPLESSAERRLKASLPSQNRIPDQFFIEYHEDLLKKCKLKNYDQRERKQLDDLEMLADLQHHRAATCLIDFTRNALVALWFACEKSGADGRVFLVNIADEKTFLETTSADIENKSISDILGFKTRETGKDQTVDRPTPETLATSPNKPDFWYWAPAHLNERITAQHSLFLFGLPSSGELNSEELIIESASKDQIRKDLEDLQDIREESLFPDFVGFAYTQRYNAPYPVPDAEEYISRGVEAGQRGQYSDAIENFTKAIELKPDYAKAYYARGLTYSSQGEHEQAIQDATKTIELKPDDAEAYYTRGLIYNNQGELEQAIQDFSKTIELKPDDAEVYTIRSSIYSSQGEHEQAIQDATKAIELKPDHADAYVMRGLAYGIQGEHEQVIEDATKAIELKPDYTEAYYTRGLAYSIQGKYDRAIQDATKAIELKPDHDEAYHARGRAYFSQGKYDHAIEDATKAIELKPDYTEAYYDRGHAYLRQGKYDHAIEDATKAIELKPDHADAYYILGCVYLRQGKYDHAIEDATKAIELKPDHADAYYARGFTYGIQGENDRAIEDFSKAIEINPDNAEVYYNRACSWLFLEKWKEAKADLTTAKDMGFDIVASFRQYTESVADFEQQIAEISLPEDIAAMLTESEN
ncbi:MAG: tetratricopeptide repeat protein [Gemmatimonadota bacterium]|nr:tetratricopeptide repeat protein [Gemmatimonadota bacterium]